MIKSEYTDSQIISTFRYHGLKVTPQRIAIANYVLNNSGHPTAKMIYQEIREIHPTVSLATIYNTINVLKEVGLIQELNLPNGQSRFDPNLEPHVHLICMKCGDIANWVEPLLSEMISRISDDADFSLNGLALEIHGLCRKCQADTNS